MEDIPRERTERTSRIRQHLSIVGVFAATVAVGAWFTGTIIHAEEPVVEEASSNDVVVAEVPSVAEVADADAVDVVAVAIVESETMPPPVPSPQPDAVSAPVPALVPAPALTSVDPTTTVVNLRVMVPTGTPRMVGVGDDGIIARSADGGATWIFQRLATGVALTDVVFPTPDTGYAVGQLGTVVKTTDGGASWIAQPSPMTGDPLLTGVAFSNASEGWVVGDNGLVMMTTDGGATWVRVESGTNAVLRAVTAFHGGIMAAGDDGVLRVPITGAPVHMLTSAGVRALVAVSRVATDGSERAYAVDAAGALFTTADHGTTWTPCGDVSSVFSDVAVTGTQSAIAVGDGVIVRTADGGSTWSTAWRGGAVQLTSVRIADDHRNGVALAADGRMLRTLAGGAMWFVGAGVHRE